MAIVGAFARIEAGTHEEIRERLGAQDGVSTFDLPDPGLVGLLIEASDIDAAHARLTEGLRQETGVLGVWPVYVNTEDEELVPETGPKERGDV